MCWAPHELRDVGPDPWVPRGGHPITAAVRWVLIKELRLELWVCAGEGWWHRGCGLMETDS